MSEYSFVRYLLAKRPVDDRALNRQVLAVLERHLAPRAELLRVLELGAGVGTMATRLADWRVLRKAEYTLLDRDVESLAAARRHLEGWGDVSGTDGHSMVVNGSGARLDVRFEGADLYAFLDAASKARPYDLVVAHAVLDLLDLDRVLPAIWSVLKPGGAFWFTINFDGETIFLPELPLDPAIMAVYHASMGVDAAGTRGGNSKTGRRLLQAIPQTGALLLAAGSSDWVVFPSGGRYPGDEAYFLHHIIEFIRAAAVGSGELDQGAVEGWVRARHAQVERGELSYIAHQLDVFGQRPSNASPAG